MITGEMGAAASTPMSAVVRDWGLKLKTDIPKPVAKPGWVVVQVKAAGINPVI